MIHRVIFLRCLKLAGVVGGLVSLTFPETNGHVMMETIEEAERFYRGEKSHKNSNLGTE